MGDGLADLGYLCQDYHGDAYEMKVWPERTFAALNLPTEAEFLAEYCKHAGRDGLRTGISI